MNINSYLSFIRLSFLSILTYRLRYYTGIVTYTLFVAVNYFIWKAIYTSNTSDTTINGFTLSEMITYISVAWISRSLYFSNIDEEIDDIVRSGQISIYLLRPVNFHLMMLSQAAGETIFRVLFFTGPILFSVIMFFPVAPPVSFNAAILFLVATFNSFLIMAEINFNIGLLSFSLKSIQSISRAKYYLIQLLSGLLMPISFFPSWFSSILNLLPFKLITYTPLQLYLGKYTDEEIANVFIEEFVWISILFLVSYRFWRYSIRQLTLQGG